MGNTRRVGMGQISLHTRRPMGVGGSVVISARGESPL